MRELDVYVAIHVLGYYYEPRFAGDTTGYYVRGDERIISEDLPNYSADRGAADHVVEAMRERGYRFTSYEQPGTGVRIAGFFDAQEYGASVGETSEAHAISEAALQALATRNP